jgi:hypothetical protein
MLIEYFLEYMDDCQALGLDKDTVINNILDKYEFDRSDLELIWEIGLAD